MLKPKHFNYFSTYLLAQEAEKRGIQVRKVFPRGPLAKNSQIELIYKSHREVIIGQRTSKTDCIGYWIAKNKQTAKQFFKQAGIQVAKGEIFHAKKDLEIITRFCNRVKYPVVLKPISGTHGRKVFTGIDSDKMLKKYLKRFAGRLIVEKEFTGKEYRLLATRKKFLAAVHRIPANVHGDGIHTIKELIALKNKDPRRDTGHKKSLVKIKIDKVVESHLKKIKKRLSYVPKVDEVVFLRENSNISTGGDSVDVTKIIHPQVKKLAVKVVQAIPGLALGGIDYLTKDITKAPTARNYIIIEVNDSPMLSMHHIPYKGKERDIAKEMIDMIFPETKGQYL